MKRVLCFAVMALLIGGFAFAGGGAEEDTGMKVGLVFDVGGRGDKSFNDSAYNGMVLLAEEYDGFIADDPDDVDFGDNVELKYLEPQSGGQDREQLLRVLAEDGYDLLYGVGFAFTDSLGKVAADFPDTHFVLIDGYIPDLGTDSNITCVAFAEHEGSFLVGALAGYALADVAPTAALGFIGGMDIPLIHKFHAGFFAGAMYANEDFRAEGRLMGQYVGQDPSAFNNPQTAEDIAVNMYNRGAGIIYHAAGASGNGLFKAASDMDRWAIGVDSDQGLIFANAESAQERAIADHILTSMLKRVDQSVFLTGSDFIDDNEIEGGYVTFGLDDNGVGVAINEFNEELIEPYLPDVNELREMVIDGEITVPDHDDQIEAWMQETF